MEELKALLKEALMGKYSLLVEAPVGDAELVAELPRPRQARQL